MDDSRSGESVRLCLRFLILTGARSGEARNARWADVDTDAREWRIPGRAGRCAIDDTTFGNALTAAGFGERATVHGFRTTFRTWCADTGENRQDAEAALAHTVQGVEGAYQRSDLFERRRSLMHRWGEFVAAA